MKTLFMLCIVLALTCSAFGSPEGNRDLVVRSRRDLKEHSLKIIQHLIANLQAFTQNALDSVGRFTSELVTVDEHMRDMIPEDIVSFKNRVFTAINNLYERFFNNSTSIMECMYSNRDPAAAMFEDLTSNTLNCVDERVIEVGTLIQKLRTSAIAVLTEAFSALESVKQCTAANTDLLHTGICLVIVVLQSQMNSAFFFAESMALIARIEMSLKTIPTTLEMCAERQLVQAGMQTGKIVVDIGTCSAIAAFNDMIGTV